jgi:hypothetical protein
MPNQVPNPDAAPASHRCGLYVIGPIYLGFVVGSILGFGTGVACVIPLAVWSVQRCRTADELEA